MLEILYGRFQYSSWKAEVSLHGSNEMGCRWQKLMVLVFKVFCLQLSVGWAHQEKYFLKTLVWMYETALHWFRTLDCQEQGSDGGLSYYLLPGLDMSGTGVLHGWLLPRARQVLCTPWGRSGQRAKCQPCVLLENFTLLPLLASPEPPPSQPIFCWGSGCGLATTFTSFPPRGWLQST